MKKQFKKILHFLYKEFILPPKLDYMRRKDTRALRREIKQADYLSEQHKGRKYVVMKNAYGRYQSFNREQFLELRRKRHGVFNPKATWEDILRDASYVTK